MPYQTINFSDVDSFEPMPGNEWYGVEIDKVEVRENKDGDALYLNWELVVVDGDYENRRLWFITSLKETALFRLKTVLDALGVLEDDSGIDIEYDDDIEPGRKAGPRLLYPELEGLECSAFVKNEMYDGVERNKVQELRSEQPKSKKRKAAREEPPTRATRSRRDVEDEEDESPRRGRKVVEDDDDDEYEEERQPRRARAATKTRGRRRVR